MTTDRWQRLQELFDQARALRPEERDEFLADACSDDAELRAEVKSLLTQDEEAPPDFMQPPEPGPEIRRGRDLGVPDPRIRGRHTPGDGDNHPAPAGQHYHSLQSGGIHPQNRGPDP